MILHVARSADNRALVVTRAQLPSQVRIARVRAGPWSGNLDVAAGKNHADLGKLPIGARRQFKRSDTSFT